MNVYAALDLEFLCNSLAGVGICVGNSEGRVLAQKEWWISLPERLQYEPNSNWVDFWLKHDAARWRLLHGSYTFTTVVDQVFEFWDSVPQKFSIKEEDLKLLSDDPAADFAIFPKLRYTKAGKSRPIYNAAESLRFCGLYQFVFEEVDAFAPKDHCPGNDARHCFYMSLIADRIRPEIQVNPGNAWQAAREAVDFYRTKALEDACEGLQLFG